jgi:hypothetical protein
LSQNEETIKETGGYSVRCDLRSDEERLMIRYEIKRSHPCGDKYLLMVGDSGTCYAWAGTWRECAEKLRERHPRAKLRITQNLLVSNSVDRFLAGNKA